MTKIGFENNNIIMPDGSLSPTLVDNAGIDANTILYIKGDGTQGSQTFNDLSPNNHTVSPVNQVSHIRTQTLANVSSILFDEVDDLMTIPNHSDFDIGSGDFTIEAWVFMDDVPTVNPDVYRIMAQGELEANIGDWCFGIGGTNGWGGGYRMNMAIKTAEGVVDYISNAIDACDAPPYKWTHFAVSRASGTLRMFKDGAVIFTDTSSESITSAADSNIIVGARWGFGAYMEEFSGLMDEIRFSNVARYTADFTPVYQHNGYSLRATDANGNTMSYVSKIIL
jgi:hypothetical protein